jgi:hypothetical protein
MTVFYCLTFATPPTWRARSPYLYPPRTRWPSYNPRHWVPFSSPPTTRRATVEVLEPASTLVHGKDNLLRLVYCSLSAVRAECGGQHVWCNVRCYATGTRLHKAPRFHYTQNPRGSSWSDAEHTNAWRSQVRIPAGYFWTLLAFPNSYQKREQNLKWAL